MIVKKKKLKSNCVICGVECRLDSNQTCGTPECRLAAHDLIHRMIQETQQAKGCEVFV